MFEAIAKRAKRTRRSAVKALVPLVCTLGEMWRGPHPRSRKEVPDRILVVNPAHLGDIVLSTYVLPILRAAYPHAEIGFLTGSWSSMVIAGHPHINHTHVTDHWRLNRASMGWFAKWRIYRATRKNAVREICLLQYDMAIHLFNYDPNLLDISWAAEIPVRLGFSDSLLAPLATDTVDQKAGYLVHQSVRQAHVLQSLKLAPQVMARGRSQLAEFGESGRMEVCRLLDCDNLEAKRYWVIHVGTGSHEKEMPAAFWREIAEELSATQTVLFTGRGQREQSTIAEVCKGLGNCVDACGKLSWGGFVSAVRYCAALFGVDSMAGHVAAAVGTKSIVAYCGISGVARWRPYGNLATVFTNHVMCSPCLYPRGCGDMICKSIDAKELIDVVTQANARIASGEMCELPSAFLEATAPLAAMGVPK